MPILPPVALAEADARRIIVDEAGKAKIAFAADGRTVKNVHIPASSGGTDHVVTVTLDGRDRKRGVSYVYVSGDEDLETWAEADAGVRETVEHDGERVKASLGMAIGKRIEGRVAVFMPAVANTREEAKEKLRQQVRDFLAYLKAQGVI